MLASFIEQNKEKDLIGKVIVKIITALLQTYPGLYKETMAEILPKVPKPLLRGIAADLINLEMKHTWIVHPSSRELSSPLLTRIVSYGILIELEDITII